MKIGGWRGVLVWEFENGLEEFLGDEMSDGFSADLW